MQILCTGSTGLVASEFKSLCLSQNISFFGIDLRGEGESIDIGNYNQLFSYLKKIKTSLISATKIQENQNQESKFILFHFAAITLTGKKLNSDQINLTYAVNVTGTENILRACEKLEIPLVHISTDFVFSGANKDTPYLSSDEPKADETPYSLSKLEAEKRVLAVKDNQKVFITRIAFPYGNFSHEKKCLVRKMIAWMEENPEVNLYNNQKTCPTPISYISSACFKIAQLISDDKINSGQIFHVVGKETTPYKFGLLVKEIFAKNIQLNPTNAPSDISKNMVLDTVETDTILGISSPGHQEELQKLKSSQLF